MNHQYNYSIIIPHKNCPLLLQRALDSIPKREDIQIIIVDDNSDSDCVDFDKFPGINRNGVEVYFTKDAKGAGFARNYGITKSLGNWILFMDADDFYYTEAFNTFDSYLNSNLEVIIFAANSLDSDTLGPSKRKRIISNESVINYDPFNPETELLLRFKNFAAWNKMIRKNIILDNNLQFDEIPVNNDVFFSFKLGLLYTKVEVVKKELYCLTYRKTSISYKKRTCEDEFNFIKMRVRANAFHKKYGHKNLERSLIPLFIKTLKSNGIIFFFKYILYVFNKRKSLLYYKKNYEL